MRGQFGNACLVVSQTSDIVPGPQTRGCLEMFESMHAPPVTACCVVVGLMTGSGVVFGAVPSEAILGQG